MALCRAFCSIRALLRPCQQIPTDHLSRHFVAHSLLREKQFPPRISINESDITESFLKGTGPGGQKINKTSSAVQLQHHPTGIVVKCQATRSRDQNRKLARKLLSERIEEATLGDQARTRVKEREAARKRSSAVKKSKRKYRKLDAEREAAVSAHSSAAEVESGDELKSTGESVPGPHGTGRLSPLP